MTENNDVKVKPLSICYLQLEGDRAWKDLTGRIEKLLEAEKDKFFNLPEKDEDGIKIQRLKVKFQNDLWKQIKVIIENSKTEKGIK